jgi:energy-coupling factor transporter ATP-binding protein EcfA2
MVPTRHSNPFATCWTRPGAITFRFADGHTADGLVERLHRQGWWGEIVGPHGSGKSTLLAALEPLLAAAGRSAHAHALHCGEHHLPRGFLSHALSSPAALVVVDGYEQLHWLDRVWLKHRCRRAAAGLLVTTHQAAGLPSLVRLTPDLTLVRQLVAVLSDGAATAVTRDDVDACFACHGSNVREVFFDLYDRHERTRRTAGGCRA